MQHVHQWGSRDGDIKALRTLHYATDGWCWKIRWDLTADAGTWHGVTMDNDGRVVSLRLKDNDLKGMHPLSELSSSSRDNRFSGGLKY